MEDDLGFDILAASLRADRADLSAFAEALSGKLEDALPERTAVVRRGEGMLSRRKRVRSIAVRMDDAVYGIAFEGGSAEAERRTEVRGVTIRREPLAVDEWIDGLSRSLAELAARSEQARVSLGRLLE
ncbi:MAG TPA: hypothetical protein VMU66_02630 [Gaiellales bacterium]|nr:hypothetical protein [Gaiellales bacterium]